MNWNDKKLRAFARPACTFLLAAAALGSLEGCSSSDSSTEYDAAIDDTTVDEANTPSISAVRVVVAKLHSPTVDTEATGRVAAWREVEVAAELSGMVEQWPHREGAIVQAGGLLVKVDAREAIIAHDEAQAELLKAQTEYAIRLSDSNDGAVDTTQVAAARARWYIARQGMQNGAHTRAEADEARRAFEAAVIRSGGRRSEVQAVTIGLAQAEQRVARAALELERTAVRAPFGGRIADVEVEQGQRIGIGETLFRLLDDRRMRVEVDVLEADLVRIKRGAKASVRIPALDDEVIEGEVYAINPQVDVEAGTGRVTVVVPNPGRALVAGLFCYVSLEVGQLQDRIVVPKEAILVRQGRDLVFKVEEGRAQWVYVTAGVRTGDWVEVTEGVAPGDSVAVDGHFALAHDAPVQVSSVLEGYGIKEE